MMDDRQVKAIAVKTNQAFNGASQYGQMIMNPEQMPYVYEKFYGGASFLVKQNMYRNFDFKRATTMVDTALALQPLSLPCKPKKSSRCS